jgi:hypothetical protein
MSEITDIWFRCASDLEELGTQIGLQQIEADAENVWEWITGSFGPYRLDITRKDALTPATTDTRIFLLGEERIFPQAVSQALIQRLQALAIRPIHLGRWDYIKGEEYAKVVVETVK